MATTSFVLEGVLAAQICKLDADKTRLTGPEDKIVLPGEMLYDVDPEQLFRTYGEIDVPGYNRPEIRRALPSANITLSLAPGIDPETLALFGAANTFGTAAFTYGVEALCDALACFCDKAAGSAVEITLWACARGCKGGCLFDPDGNELHGFIALPCLENLQISEWPGINRAGEDPDPWTLTGTASGNSMYGTGPGGVVTTDNPDGITCWMARGLTPVPPPVPCDVDCETFEWGYASGALAY